MTPEDDVADALACLGKRSMSGLDRRLLGDLRARLLGRAPHPHAIGRFTVLSEIGRGGMGTVYAVYDPQLDRKVALKALLQPSMEDSESLLWEAKRLARVRHPNVAAVHDAFVEDGVVYVAMELVEGQTLDDWHDDQQASARETVGVLVQAGLGLAAVHEAGLIHRDFKPSNVIMGVDGRAQLVDFGLAVPREEGSLSIAGTEGYIAPECFEGAPPSPRSDQFSFCVVAARMLGASVAVERGRVVNVQWDGVPGPTADVLGRGLEADPLARFTDMGHLLTRLSAAMPVPGGRRRALLLLTGGAAGAALLGWGIVQGQGTYRSWQDDKRIEECASVATDEMAALWSGVRREVVRRGLLASGVPYADATVDKTLPVLDRYAQQWMDARVSSCTTTFAPFIEQRSDWCLQAGRSEFDVMLESFEASDPGITGVATELAAGLSPAELCNDVDALRRMPDPPRASQRDAVADVMREVALVAASRRLGRGDHGLGRAEQALAAAQSVAWQPLLASAHLRLAESLAAGSSLEEAEVHYEEAFFAARESGAGGLAADVALALAEHTGTLMVQRETGLLWLRHAELLIDQETGRLERGHRALAVSARANIAHVDGAFEEAERLHLESVAAWEHVVGSAHPSYAAALNDLGLVQRDLGRGDSAITTLQRSAAVAEVALGPDHPSVAAVLSNLSQALRRVERFDQALEVQQRALSIDRAALGDADPGLAFHYSNLAGIHGDLGDAAAELQARETVLELLSGAQTARTPAVVIAHANLAQTFAKWGRPEDAERVYATLLPLARDVMGEGHHLFGRVLNNRAATLGQLGRIQESADTYAEAIANWEQHEVPAAEMAMLSSNYAVKLAELGRIDESLRRVRKDVETLEEARGPSHGTVAEVKLKLGRILRIAEREGEATDVYREALGIFETIPGEQSGETAVREQLRELEGG